jgi:creatinine amidohydrolase
VTTPRPWIVGEATWNAVRAAKYEVIVLPWGACEAHNTHLPYATDIVETEAVAAESAGRAWARGARVGVLPAVPFGVQTGQLDIPLCVNLNPSTQAAVLADIVRSLDVQGFRKLVILNGHGGNDFRQMVRELEPTTAVFSSIINWYAVEDPRPHFGDTGDHAGELETSVMLHLAPAFVAPLSEAGQGAARVSRLRGIRERWAWAPRQWTKVTDDTGIGSPAAATAAKGERYFDIVCDQIASYFVELAALDLASRYE